MKPTSILLSARRAFVLCALALICAAAGLRCGPKSPTSVAGSAPDKAAMTPAQRQAYRDKGLALFLAECSGCHGEKGRGDGPMAASFPMRPRNFTLERFKFRTTPSFKDPRREDIFRTISDGLPGTGMPSFDFLPEEDRHALVDHVFRLAGLEDAPEPEPIALGKEPKGGAEAVARGRAVYEKMQCFKCHGDKGLADGPSAATLKDNLGRTTLPPNLVTGYFRRGKTVSDIARTFLTGIDGTPMPAFQTSMTEAEAWDLAFYMQSLQQPRPAAPADLVARGAWVIEEKQCRACHTIGGEGGRIGPNLDVSAKKLHLSWIENFLPDPRKAGKIYPFIRYRMPDLHLTPEDAKGVVAYLAKGAGRAYPEPTETLPEVTDEQIGLGQLLYVAKCAECHNLGTVIPTPEAKRQGPDLIQLRERVRYEWIPEWVAKPQNVYPGTAMVDTNLKDEEIQMIRAFLWRATQTPAK